MHCLVFRHQEPQANLTFLLLMTSFVLYVFIFVTCFSIHSFMSFLSCRRSFILSRKTWRCCICNSNFSFESVLSPVSGVMDCCAKISLTVSLVYLYISVTLSPFITCPITSASIGAALKTVSPSNIFPSSGMESEITTSFNAASVSLCIAGPEKMA